MYGSAQSNPGNVLDRNSLSEMNLKVLKRIDPFTEELLASAGHVALYDFQTGEKKWVQKGVEGTLFLIRRHSAPFYRYIVLNKKSQDHYMEDLYNGFKFEAGERYGRMFLLYKNCKSEVVGIWFYDTEECEKVITLLKGIASKHPQPPQPPAEDGGGISYPLTIGSLPHQSPAQPREGQGVVVSMTSPENSFWDRGPVSAPGGGNPLYLADGRTLADAPGLTPRPGNPQQPHATASNPLERLFGQSARLPSTQPPIASSIPPLPSGSLGGLPPFRNAEQPQAGAEPVSGKQLAAFPSLPPTHPPLPATHKAPNELHFASPQGKKPVQPLDTPFAGQPQQTSQMSRANTPQASTSLPSLLKPSHFQAAGSARTADQEGAQSLTSPSQTAPPPSIPSQTLKQPSQTATPPPLPSPSPSQTLPSQTLDQSNAQETFMKLFNAKDKGPETPLEQHAGAEVEKSLESLVAETPLKDGASEDLLPEKYAKARSSTDSGGNNRVSTDSGNKSNPPSGTANRNAALVRSAVRALADSDAFIDILVRELDRSGLLR